LQDEARFASQGEVRPRFPAKSASPVPEGTRTRPAAGAAAANRAARKPTWDAENPDGRWRTFDFAELAKRDKANLDIFWLKDKSLEESDDLPEPDELAREIADDLQTAFEQFSTIAGKLKV
jgi:hypothetical protein